MTLSHSLLKAWGWLVGLSLLAAAVTLSPLGRAPAAGVILLLALFKTRIILSRYLDLQRAPDWLRGATLVFALWTCLAYGLYLLPALMP